MEITDGSGFPREQVIPQNIFLQYLPFCFCSCDLIITHLLALHCNTFTGIFMYCLSFVTFFQFAVFPIYSFTSL